MKNQRAQILKIQRYSVNDGPGIRTTVFFKGCPLKCAWCHNPDSITRNNQLSLARNMCTSCGKCVSACANGVHSIIDGRHVVRHDKCQLCVACVEACPNSALSILGEEMTVGDIMATIERDKDYYIESNGGITVSGGEPTLYHEYVAELFDRAHQIGINTALDSSGYCNSVIFEKLMAKTDFLLLDLKIIDAALHMQYTGVDNKIIINNFLRAIALGVQIVIRHIVVPEVNDSLLEHEALAKLLLDNNFSGSLELLPYHSMGRAKYDSIGAEYSLGNIMAPTSEQMELIKNFFIDKGIKTKIN